MHRGLGPTSEIPQVAVVVVSYKRADLVEAFVKSTMESVGVEAQVIVVDNASGTETIAHLRKLRIELVELRANIGYGGAFNQVLPTLLQRFDYIAVANQDLTLERESLQRMVATIRRNPRAFVGPTLVAQGNHVVSARNSPPILSRSFLELALSEQIARTREQNDGMAECGWISGAFLAARTEDWVGVKGFDERYFMYVEEVDLLDRHRRVGGKVLLASDAIARHEKPDSVIDPTLYAGAVLNWVRFYSDRQGALAGWLIFLAGWLGCVSRALVWTVISLSSHGNRRRAAMFRSVVRVLSITRARSIINSHRVPAGSAKC